MRQLAIAAFALGSILSLSALAFAHDQPTLRVDPAIVPVGGTVTVTGVDMDLDSRWAVTLERSGRSMMMRDSILATGDDEGGFAVKLSIPADTQPGSYKLRATSTDGKTCTADLTVTDKSSAADPGAATMKMASGEEHVIDRSKPATELATLWALAAAATILGIVLLRTGHA